MQENKYLLMFFAVQPNKINVNAICCVISQLSRSYLGVYRCTLSRSYLGVYAQTPTQAQAHIYFPLKVSMYCVQVQFYYLETGSGFSSKSNDLIEQLPIPISKITTIAWVTSKIISVWCILCHYIHQPLI